MIISTNNRHGIMVTGEWQVIVSGEHRMFQSQYKIEKGYNEEAISAKQIRKTLNRGRTKT